MTKRSGLFILIFGWLLTGFAEAQNPSPFLQQVLEKELNRKTVGAKYPGQLREFYFLCGYKMAWVTNEPALLQLLQQMENAPDMGLRKEDYQHEFLSRFRKSQLSLVTIADSLLADFRITDAAIHFFHDAAFGSHPPSIGYNGLNYSPDCFSIPSLLASALSSGRFDIFLQEIELKSPEYIAVKNMVTRYNKAAVDTLYKKALMATSGNVPLKARIEELSRTLNTMRWLRCARVQNEHIIVVNIPSANLLVYEPGKVTLESKVIVGQNTNRTPTLASKVTEVILYPYWNVPKKIATKELLPLIKKNPGYLDANNFQVVNENGKVVNPAAINWQELSDAHFPYTLRQSTGCDNSLGLVKLNFYSPFVVYLHDTPWKSLFQLNKRFFSHGCMRVEKAMDLARLIMKDNTAVIDTLTEKGCLYNQRPVTLAASEKMPVFVLYNTVWVDSAATVRFYGDVYNKFPSSRK